MDKLKVLKSFSGHSHSKSVKLLEGDIVKKEFINGQKYYQELAVLNKLKQFDFVPKIIEVDNDKHIIYTAYCGRQINISEFFKHAKKIDKLSKLITQKTGIYHNDVKPRNICISADNKIHLIDFSLANTKPIRVFSNGKIEKRFNTVAEYIATTSELRRKRMFNKAKKLQAERQKQANAVRAKLRHMSNKLAEASKHASKHANKHTTNTTPSTDINAIRNAEKIKILQMKKALYKGGLSSLYKIRDKKSKQNKKMIKTQENINANANTGSESAQNTTQTCRKKGVTLKELKLAQIKHQNMVVSPGLEKPIISLNSEKNE